MPNSPIDLLPIKRPLEDPELPADDYFYNNVISKLIPDIIRMTSNGIPIDLTKVSKVEDTVNYVLDNVEKELVSNPLMLEFLQEQNTQKRKDETITLEAKKKSVEDFLKEPNLSNKIHRTYIVNEYLRENNKEDMMMEEWSIKDVKKLNQIIASKFLSNIIEKKIEPFMSDIVSLGMTRLATEKAAVYNKNHVATKIQELDGKDLVGKFNPGSSTQKVKFFESIGVESTNETKAGNPKWDRAELENLKDLLDILIEEKE